MPIKVHQVCTVGTSLIGDWFRFSAEKNSDDLVFATTFATGTAMLVRVSRL